MPDDENAERGGEAKFDVNQKVVTWIALSILVSIILMIGAAIFGLDKGQVLERMGQIEFARGLITYLFAVVTIGTAVLLIVSALTTAADDLHERRFNRGKEILSLLLGVFGTIVGFYFGSEVNKATANGLSLAPLRIARSGPPPNSQITLTTFASGGKPPYEYRVIVGDEQPGKFDPVPEGGWIVTQIQAPTGTIQLVVEVRDADAHSFRQVAYFAGQP